MTHQPCASADDATAVPRSRTRLLRCGTSPAQRGPNKWQQLLALFSMTRHDLGPIDVEIDAGEAKAKCPVHIFHFLRGAPGGEEWVVNGEYTVTLKRQYGRWQIQKIILDVQSQEGNTDLLVEAFAPAVGR